MYVLAEIRVLEFEQGAVATFDSRWVLDLRIRDM